MSIDEKVRRILNAGGVIYIHEADAARLKEAEALTRKPPIFSTAKVCVDKSGVVEEGRPVAAIIAGESQEFDFAASFVNS